MKSLVAAAVAVCLVAAPVHAAEGDPLVYKPEGQWAADFGEDYCRLVRTFSDGTNRISLVLERMQPSSQVKIMLVGNGIKLYRRADSIGYQYLPSGENRTSQLLRSDSTDGEQMLIMDGVNIGPAIVPPPEPGTPYYSAIAEAEYAAGITGLLLTEGTLEPVSFATGSSKGAIGVLQDCTYDLLSYWGLDGAKHRTLSRTIVPQSGTVLPRGTVGFQDFAKLAGSANMIRLMIDETGKPTACHVHFASLDETTNAKICSHLMKASFLPALDSAGQPMASYWISSPFFMMGPPPGG